MSSGPYIIVICLGSASNLQVEFLPCSRSLSLFCSLLPSLSSLSPSERERERERESSFSRAFSLRERERESLIRTLTLARSLTFTANRSPSLSLTLPLSLSRVCGQDCWCFLFSPLSSWCYLASREGGAGDLAGQVGADQAKKVDIRRGGGWIGSHAVL